MSQIGNEIGRVVPADDLASDLETVRQAKALAKQWADLADATMARIKDRIGNHDGATIDGRLAVRRSERTVTRLDTKALKADIPAEVLAPYMRPTVEWRYELVELND